MFALLNILGSEKYGRLHLLRLRNRDLCKYMKKHGRPNQQSYVVIHQIVQVFFVLIKKYLDQTKHLSTHSLLEICLDV